MGYSVRFLRLPFSPADLHKRTNQDPHHVVKKAVARERNLDFLPLPLNVDGVDPADGMPVQVVYRVDGAAAPLRIRIDRLVPNVPVKDSDFTFDPQKHPGVEVIDFR